MAGAKTAPGLFAKGGAQQPFPSERSRARAFVLGLVCVWPVQTSDHPRIREEGRRFLAKLGGLQDGDLDVDLRLRVRVDIAVVVPNRGIEAQVVGDAAGEEPEG